MKTKTLSFLSSAIAAATLSAALISCGEAADAPAAPADTGAAQAAETVTEAETTASSAKALIGAEDYGEYAFNILYPAFGDAAVAWRIYDVDADSQNGELINDAVYERNLAVEEAFNCVIGATALDYTTVPSTVSKVVSAGDPTYDAVQSSVKNQCDMLLGGYTADLARLPEINLSASYWAPSLTGGFSVSGRTYCATGDICLNDDKSTWSYLFNKKLAENYGLPDMYQVARDGKWTLDLLRSFAQNAAADLNGDGQLKFGEDQFGLYDQMESSVALYLGTGRKAVEIGADGSITFNLDSESSVGAWDKIYDFMQNTDYIMHADKVSVDDVWNKVRANFRADQMLFYNVTVSGYTLIRDMETDFGVLPICKLDEAQNGYYSTIQPANCHAYAIPMSAADVGRSARLLEAMAMMSPETLTEAYYSNTLQQKAVRDTESIEMMEMIFGSRVIDVGFLFEKIGFLNFFNTEAGKKTNSFVSDEAKKHDKTIAAIEELVETISAL